MMSIARALLAVVCAAACVPSVPDSDEGGGAASPAGEGYRRLAPHPHNVESVWSNEAQGLAHDATSWLVSTRWAIYRYPLGADLEGDGFVAAAPGPSDCDHIGDIDQQGGEVFAPLELCDGASPNRMVVFDAETLTSKRWASVPLAAQEKLSWVAVSPVDGLIYTSDFEAEWLNVYSPEFADGGVLELVRRVKLGRHIHRVQGGEFSPSGKLYLVSDDAQHPERAGIYVFTLGEERASLMAHIPAPRFAVSRGNEKEMEGITVWDLGERGQLHWVALDNDGLFDGDDAGVEHIGLSGVEL